MILSADTASEKYKLLSKKHREYFVYSRAFLQRRLCFAAAGAVLKPAGRELCGVALGTQHALQAFQGCKACADGKYTGGVGQLF